MLDIGWPEFLVILVVALIVIGPKDLPRSLNTVGKWVRKARMLTREFQTHIDDMVREAELEEVRDQAKKLAPGSISKEVEKTIDPSGSLRNAFDPGKTGDAQDAKTTGGQANGKAAGGQTGSERAPGAEASPKGGGTDAEPSPTVPSTDEDPRGERAQPVATA